MRKVINGEIYDTDKAELIAKGPLVNVYLDKNGNWFEVIRSIFNKGFDLHPLRKKEAKSLVCLHAPEKYDELFEQA